MRDYAYECCKKNVSSVFGPVYAFSIDRPNDANGTFFSTISLGEKILNVAVHKNVYEAVL